jgi:hypothetical protein
MSGHLPLRRRCGHVDAKALVERGLDRADGVLERHVLDALVPRLDRHRALVTLALQCAHEAGDVGHPGPQGKLPSELGHHEHVVALEAVIELDVEDVLEIEVMEVEETRAAVLPVVDVEFEAGTPIEIRGGDETPHAVDRVDEIVSGRDASLDRADELERQLEAVRIEDWPECRHSFRETPEVVVEPHLVGERRQIGNHDAAADLPGLLLEPREASPKLRVPMLTVNGHGQPESRGAEFRRFEDRPALGRRHGHVMIEVDVHRVEAVSLRQLAHGAEVVDLVTDVATVRQVIGDVEDRIHVRA